VALVIAPVLSLADWWYEPVPSASTPTYRVRMTVRQLLNVPRDPDGAASDYFVAIYVKDRDVKFATEVQTLQNQTSDLVWDESFDLAITQLSSVLIEVYDLREVRNGVNIPRWHAVVLPLSDPLHDLLNSDGGTLQSSAHLRSPNGQFINNMMLHFSLALNPTDPIPYLQNNSLLPASPRNITRYTTYITWRFPPLISILSVEYMLQTETQNYAQPSNPGEALPLASAKWASTGSTVSMYAYGFSREFSPTVLPPSIPRRFQSVRQFSTALKNCPIYDGMISSWLPDAQTVGLEQANLRSAYALFLRMLPLRYHLSGRGHAVVFSVPFSYSTGYLRARAL
jgi:hypothetical protein